MLVKAELLLSFCLSGGELCCTYSWAFGRAWVSDRRLWERQWALATRASPDQTTARWILCKCNAMLAFCQGTDKYIGGMILAYHRHSRDVSYQRLSCPICVMQKKMPRVLYLLLLNSQWRYIYKNTFPIIVLTWLTSADYSNTHQAFHFYLPWIV